MTNVPGTQAIDGVPAYLASGDPAGRFADYYPAWMDELAGDVTLVRIYPDAAHGFLFQHHAEFAGDVDAFLRAPAEEQTRASLDATPQQRHQPRAKHSLERGSS